MEPGKVSHVSDQATEAANLASEVFSYLGQYKTPVLFKLVCTGFCVSHNNLGFPGRVIICSYCPCITINGVRFHFQKCSGLNGQLHGHLNHY